MPCHAIQYSYNSNSCCNALWENLFCNGHTIHHSSNRIYLRTHAPYILKLTFYRRHVLKSTPHSIAEESNFCPSLLTVSRGVGKGLERQVPFLDWNPFEKMEEVPQHVISTSLQCPKRQIFDIWREQRYKVETGPFVILSPRCSQTSCRWSLGCYKWTAKTVIRQISLSNISRAFLLIWLIWTFLNVDSKPHFTYDYRLFYALSLTCPI